MAQLRTSYPYPGRRYDVMRADRLEYLSVFAKSFASTEVHASTFKDMVRYREPELIGDNLVRVSTVYRPRRNPTGRLFAEHGLQGVGRHLRSFLFPAGSVDIDIVRCAPTIIHQLAMRNGLSVPHLTSHIVEYDDRLAHFNNDKQLMISILFGAALPDDMMTPDWFDPLMAEIKTVYYNTRLVGEGPRLHELAVGKGGNIMGTFMAYLYQHYENRYLMAVDDVGQRLGMWNANSTLMFDGITVQPTVVGVDVEYIQMVANRKTGFNLELIVKPLPAEAEVDISVVPKSIIITECHREAAEVLRYLSRGRVIECHDCVWFCDDSRRWDENTKRAHKFLRRLANNSNMCMRGPKGDISQYTNKVSHADSAANMCMTMLPRDDSFSYNVILRDQHKLHFANGYWDFPRGRFVEGLFERVAFIPYEFPEYNEDDVEFVETRFLAPAFDNADSAELRTFFLRSLARALAGDQDKLFFNVLGYRDSSKSVLLKLLTTALGNSDLIKTVDSSNFSAAGVNSDPTRDNAYLIPCQYARVMIISEVKTGKAGRLNGKKIKQLQSTKDGISARSLYNDAPRDMYPLVTPFLLSNHTVQTDPPDTLKEHCRIIQLPNRFVSDTIKQQHPWDPKFKKADPQIDRWSTEQRYGAAFLHIILDNYQSTAPDVLPGMMDLVEATIDNCEEEAIMELLDFTGDMTDEVDQRETKDYFKNRDMNMATVIRIAQTMLDDVLRRKGRQSFPVHARPRVDGRQIRVLRGVRLRDVYVGGRTRADTTTTTTASDGYAVGFAPTSR